jgi:hypothetical protein
MEGGEDQSSTTPSVLDRVSDITGEPMFVEVWRNPKAATPIYFASWKTETTKDPNGNYIKFPFVSREDWQALRKIPGAPIYPRAGMEQPEFDEAVAQIDEKNARAPAPAINGGRAIPPSNIRPMPPGASPLKKAKTESTAGVTITLAHEEIMVLRAILSKCNAN